MSFHGRTTSPWHVGRTKYSDYLYTRRDYLWGRGVRGPLLRQLWRSYCPKSDSPDKVRFSPERDCSSCNVAGDCAFNNLRGTADEGEFKDRPRLITTNLRFKDAGLGRVALATLSDKHLSVVEERAPVFIEFIPEGTEFNFEVIMVGEGTRFAGELESSVRICLKFHGLGGFCNEGFGRGEVTNVEKNSFNAFEYKYITPYVEKMIGAPSLTFTIEPMLILDKDVGGVYGSIIEAGFKEKFANCLNERYWQFYGKHIHVQQKIAEVSGLARTVKIRGWSRRLGHGFPFVGIGNEVTLRLIDRLDWGEAAALALGKYGVGRYKNQGFGSLMLKT